MTTTPAPTDLDTAVDVAAHAIQAYQARTAFPPEQYTWDAIPQEWRDRHLAAARVMVEAAMMPVLEELAKTRAELDEIKGKIAHPTVKGVLNLIELCEERWHRAEAAHEAKDEANRRWLESENGLKSAWEEIEYWRTKNGLPTPEANPATTAEPTDEPKATRCPVLHEDGVTRCHDDAGHAGDEHGGTGPHGHKTWTVS